MRPRRQLWIFGGVGIGLLALLVVAFRPSPVLVDVALIERGTLQVSVDDDGQTRVRERYTISAPIQGSLLRVALNPGDDVRAGLTVVAEFSPRDPDLLDKRTLAETEARVARAEAALGEAAARKKQARAELQFANEELERTRVLFEKSYQSKDVLEQRQRDAQRAREGLRAADFSIQVARFEVEMARASLDEQRNGNSGGTEAGEASEAPGRSEPPPVRPFSAEAEQDMRGNSRRVRLRSPIDGTVLRVFEQSARALPAGTPILEVGNTRALEIVADYLSQDAVAVRPGMAVEVRGFGATSRDAQLAPLEGEVRRVEPAGFTKVSALGVEEQRVNIVIDPVGDPERWAMLGDGYRAELRILLWKGADVLKVPIGALFRTGDAWSVFVVEDGVARLRSLEIDHRSGLEAEVVSGLSEGDRVILYPNELIRDGARVQQHA